MDSYYAGQLVRAGTYSGNVSFPTGGFRDANGDLADPLTVTLTYQPGEHAAVIVITTPDARIVRDGTGLYHCDLDTSGTAYGPWTFEWIGTGGVQATAAKTFIVRSPFT